MNTNNHAISEVDFWTASDQTLFDQEDILEVLCQSIPGIDRAFMKRMLDDDAIPYQRFGPRRFYKKSDVVDWLLKHDFCPAISDQKPLWKNRRKNH